MQIAIINPWFLMSGGGSKVVNVLAKMYPTANFFTLFSKEESLPPNVRGRTVKCSFLNEIPGIARLYRPLLPLFPIATESLDLRGYELIISCDASVVKGILVDQQAIHVCYCHTPVRYVWDLYWNFLEQAPPILRPFFAMSAHYIRQWDFLAAQRVDHFVANSEYISRRIRKYYRRDSTIIYPPVDTTHGYLGNQLGNYYLSVGRLSSTKRLDILIEACNRLGRPLLLAGTGRQEQELKRLAGPTVEFLGRVPDAKLPELYANCRALLFAADEDFGMVPVEAQSYGRPVIAYGHGGSLETVIGPENGQQPTGLFFRSQTVDSMVEAISRFETLESSFDPIFIQNQAKRFDTSIFVTRMHELIETAAQGRGE